MHIISEIKLLNILAIYFEPDFKKIEFFLKKILSCLIVFYSVGFCNYLKYLL